MWRVSDQGIVFQATIDDHSPADKAPATLRVHTASFKSQFSREMQAWQSKDGKPFEGNVAFAEWLEDQHFDVTKPPGADFLQMALTMKIEGTTKFMNAYTLADGSTTLDIAKIVNGAAQKQFRQQDQDPAAVRDLDPGFRRFRSAEVQDRGPISPSAARSGSVHLLPADPVAQGDRDRRARPDHGGAEAAQGHPALLHLIAMIPTITTDDLAKLRHMVGAGPSVPLDRRGYRNHFAAGFADLAAMERLVAAGLGIRGRALAGSHLYHATAAGCHAAGLNRAQTTRALED
jgi:hypothetical protein